MKDLKEKIQPGKITWINADGVHNTKVVQLICDQFNIHPLVQEDIVNTTQRPKIESYGDYFYFVVKMAYLVPGTSDLEIEQVSIILGKGYIISFQEKEGDVFDPIRERVYSAHGKINKMGADYLAYQLMDAVLDKYFRMLEKIGEEIDTLEEVLMEKRLEKSTQTGL